MMLLSLSFIGLISISSSFLAAPDCNYAAIGGDFYPINACEQRKTVDGVTITYSGIKYQCRVNNEVYKLTYATAEYCDGTPMIEERVTDQLDGYECDKEQCPFGQLCKISGCNDDCSDCASNPDHDMFDKYCRSIITDNCFGDNNLYEDNSCSGSASDGYALTENYFLNRHCSASPISSNTYNDTNTCDSNTYYQIECMDEILSPQCNYAATGYSFYPIGACVKERTYINDKCTQFFAFKYECNGDNLIRKEYNDADFCDGQNVTEIVANNDVTWYECDKSDCNYAEMCIQHECASYNDDGTANCDECDNLLQFAQNKQESYNKYDINCYPIITDECYGFAPLYQHVTCISNSNDAKNDLLTHNIYVDNQCAFSVYEQYRGGEGDDACKWYEKFTVSCQEDLFISAAQYNDEEKFIDDIDTPSNVQNYFKVFGYNTNTNSFQWLLLVTNAVTILLCICICIACIMQQWNKRKNNEYRKVILDVDINEEEEQALREDNSNL